MTGALSSSALAEAKWLRDNPAFRERPASIREFMGPDYLDMAGEIRPGVLEALVAIFGEEVNPKLTSAVPKAALSGSIGWGKALLPGENVLTPDRGWVRNDSLTKGDRVVGKDGKPTDVVDIYDHEDLQFYRVHFKDDTWIDCCGDHLWEVWYPSTGGKEKRKVFTAGELFTEQESKGHLRSGSAPSARYKYRIPLVDPVEFDQEGEIPCDAYTVGAFIANGSTTTGIPRLTTHDQDREEVLSSINTYGAKVSLENRDTNADRMIFSTPGDGYAQGSNPLTARLKESGTWGTRTLDKRIPERYLRAPVADRWALLRGLMDGDGHVSQSNNSSIYSTSSAGLVDDVLDLVRGLGGYATVTSFDRDDNPLHQTEYHVIINTGDVCPFSLQRKARAWTPRTNQKPRRAITHIEKSGRGAGRCIRVSAPDSLYVTKDYLVTHNSTAASIILTYFVHWVQCLHNPQTYLGMAKGSRIAFMMMSTSERQAREVLFGDIKARVQNSPWFERFCKYDPQFKNQLRFPREIWIVPGGSEETRFEGYNVLSSVIDEADCVDESTEILTASGWKPHSELSVGEEVLTLNHETGASEWQPCLEVKRFEAAPRRVLKMEGKEFSSLTTMNHRWPVVRPRKRGGKTELDRIWTTSEELGFRDRIFRSAVPSDTPRHEVHSDALVELVAWFYTEGCDVYRNGKTAYITQSPKNAGNCDRIRSALTALFGPAVDSFPRQGRKYDGVPLWREVLREDRGEYWGKAVVFVLSVAAGKIVQEHAPDKVPTFDFIRSLTKSQLELFIEVSLLADNNGERRFAQKDLRMAEAYAFACVLSGRSVSLRPHNPTSSCPSVMWNVYSSKKTFHAPVIAAAYTRYKSQENGMKIAEETYDGMVWCPRVENGSWFARRNGSCYFTGNSHKQTDTKDYAEAGLDTLSSRIISRFPDYENDSHRGLICVIGQMKSATGFMNKVYTEWSDDPHAVVRRMMLWEALGWHKFTKNPDDIRTGQETAERKSFVYDIARKKIISTSEAREGGLDFRTPDSGYIEVPTAYRDQFRRDPVKALRDLAGIPPEASDPFFAMPHRILACQEHWHSRYGADPRVGDEPTWPTLNMPKATDGIKRVIHLDLAYSATGDALGLAMGHVAGIVDVDGEEKPLIVFDLLMRIHAASGSEIILGDVRRIIYTLARDYNYPIKLVTADGFSSADTMQQLRKQHISSDYLSVDKSKQPYEDLREGIYDERVLFPKYMARIRQDDTEPVNIAYRELSQLSDTGMKIDHPSANLGSKDVADAMAGVVHLLMSQIQYRRGAMPVAHPNPTMAGVAPEEVESESLVPEPSVADLVMGDQHRDDPSESLSRSQASATPRFEDWLLRYQPNVSSQREEGDPVVSLGGKTRYDSPDSLPSQRKGT